MTSEEEEAQELIQQQESQRQALENWALERVKPWEEIKPWDYDFSSWATGAGKACLQAGAVYENARESRKLRCLLVLMNRKRPREAWEIVQPGSLNGRRPRPGEIDSHPAEVNWLPCSFGGLDQHAAERALGGFLYCLCDLADYLADNISFGELFLTKRDELEKAFGGLDKLARVRSEFRFFLPVVDAVGVARRSEIEDITVAETLFDEGKRIVLGEACSEVIAIRIRWCGFTKKEIGGGLKEIAWRHRPSHCKEPKRKGQRPKDVILAHLKALSVMRIWKLHQRNPWKRLKLVAENCGYEGCVRESEEYEWRRTGGYGDQPMSNAAQVEMSDARARALSFFQSIFPGETPSNWQGVYEAGKLT